MSDKTIAQQALEIQRAANHIGMVCGCDRNAAYLADCVAALAQLIYDSRPLNERFVQVGDHAPSSRKS